MNILLFDMDGVLIAPIGYHKALKETVRIIGLDMGLEEYHLTDSEIAEFESLGITSEWYSSALCISFFALLKDVFSDPILYFKYISKSHLKELFDSIKKQPITLPAKIRAEKAIVYLANRFQINSENYTNLIVNCESIEVSATFSIFQELVLGSNCFELTYDRPSKLNSKSYLTLFDKPLLNQTMKTKLFKWLENPDNHAAIITNRPTAQSIGKWNTPDAEIGAKLLGIEKIPIIGSGDILWLAKEYNLDPGLLLKPSATHSLAAIFASLGYSLKESLLNAFQFFHNSQLIDIELNNQDKISIFEDTSAGIISLTTLLEDIKKIDMSFNIKKIGISSSPQKLSMLKNLGANNYESINTALANILK